MNINKYMNLAWHPAFSANELTCGVQAIVRTPTVSLSRVAVENLPGQPKQTVGEMQENALCEAGL